MNAPLRRKIFVVTVGAVVLAAVVYGFLPKPVPVSAAPAARGPLRVTIEEEGRTRVRDRYTVSAPVAGYLRRIRLDVGDPVRKGDAVAALEPLRSAALDPRSRAEAEAAVGAARATYEAARERARAAAADADYAREREARMRKLAGSGYVSQDDLDQAVADLRKADANLESAEASVSAAQAELERARSVLQYSGAGGAADTVAVRSPVAGRVLKLHRESEGVVNSGDPLLDIGDPRNMEVRIEVLSADAVKLKRGTAVVFERWGGEQDLEGRVRVVEPAGFTKVSSLGVEEQRVNVLVDLTSPFAAWQRLGDGYRLDTTFVLWESGDVLQVPASALFRQGDGWALFVVEHGRARQRQVAVGKRNGLAAEIVQGVAEGETVITNPDDALQDGVRIRVR